MPTTQNQRYQESCDRTLTDLFRNLAFDEYQVEICRQNCARLNDFDPMKAFALLDTNKCGHIDSVNIVEFLQRHHVEIYLQDAAEIIREFDASMDGTLEFTEFSQFVLPATNNSLRHVAEHRHTTSQFRVHEALPYNVVSSVVHLFEKEVNLHRHRNQAKEQLALSPDFIKVRAFDMISRGQSQIAVGDLTYYLERNGFYPRREDIEAILRRLDHNADQALSYVDFCELTTISDPNASAGSPQKHQDSPLKPSPSPVKAAQITMKPVDAKPVTKFNVNADNQQTLKPKPVAVVSAQPVEKSHARIEAEKAAEVQRLKVETIIENERLEQEAASQAAISAREQELQRQQAEYEANQQLIKNQAAERESIRVAAIEEQKRKIEEERLQREAERQVAIEARKRQLEEERSLAEASRLQREQEAAQRAAQLKAEQELAEAKRAEYEKKRNVTNFMFLRLLKAVLQWLKQIESRKQILSNHSGFNADEAHDLLDTNNDGAISVREINDVLEKYQIEESSVSGLHNLLEIMNKDPDMEISLSKFKEYCEPIIQNYTPQPRCAHKRMLLAQQIQSQAPTNFEEKETQKMAWLESLLDLLNAHLEMQADHEGLKEKYMLDAEAIFEEIDVNNQEWISHGSFKRWVAKNCGFKITDEDMLIMQPILDDSRDGQITRDEFIAAFGAPVDDADLDHAGAEAEHNRRLEEQKKAQAVAAAKAGGSPVKAGGSPVKPTAPVVAVSNTTLIKPVAVSNKK